MLKGKKVNARNPNGKTLLHFAAESGQTRYVNELLDAGADATAKDQWGFTPLHYAALSGDSDLINALITKGAEVNTQDENNAIALHYAAMANQKRACELLIKKGSQPDIRDIFGQTPLDWVATNGRADILALFAGIEGKEGLNLEDMINRSPLHRAAYRGNDEVLKILLDQGAQTETADDDGRTPLHWAAKGGKKDTVQLLIAKGSQVNARDNTGRTPLHEAAISIDSEVVDLLLENGAELNARDKQGTTPLDLAQQYAREKTVQLFTGKGAESEKKPGPTELLKKQLNEKETMIWHLGHCGWAIKTKNHLLIFDYWQKGPKPANGCLANGYIDPNEIKDLNVTVFVTHGHPDHYDEVIFKWEPIVKNITYIFGWKAKTDPHYIYMHRRKAKTKIKGMKIFTIPSHHDNVPEVAYLVQVDGLVIFHSGDYIGTLRSFKSDIDYLAKKSRAERVDMAFFTATCKVGHYMMEGLSPLAAFPMHAGDSEFLHKGLSRHFAAKHPKTKFYCVENKGDCFHYQNNEMKQL